MQYTKEKVGPWVLALNHNRVLRAYAKIEVFEFRESLLQKTLIILERTSVWLVEVGINRLDPCKLDLENTVTAWRSRRILQLSTGWVVDGEEILIGFDRRQLAFEPWADYEFSGKYDKSQVSNKGSCHWRWVILRSSCVPNRAEVWMSHGFFSR